MIHYRPDVDGLRAVAVLAVLIFHAFPAVLPGGFIGVDIFFVISGFLITGIILGELKRGTFTFGNFYSRRIRRIFPALALVLTTTLAFGWLCLLPYDFAELGKHILASAGFGENILLWKEAGDYFKSEAETLPLLHLWSLGIEEQYYFLWPLLLFLVKGGRALWLILAIAVASFVTNIVLTQDIPARAFYLPQARFWELMLGSLVAYLSLHYPRAFQISYKANNCLALLGVGCLALGLTIIPQNNFPGAWALLPTVGTALLIWARPSWINQHILAQRAAVNIGLISYPLYLWHWPLLTYARILQEGEPSITIRLALLAASFLLAWGTYAFIEKRIRSVKAITVQRRAVVALATSIATLAVLGVLIFGRQIEARVAPSPGLAEISEAMHDWKFSRQSTFKGDVQDAVLFLGDSHMQQYIPRIERTATNKSTLRRTVHLKTKSGCAPIPGLERTGYNCEAWLADAFRFADDPKISTIVIASYWLAYAKRDDLYSPATHKPASPMAPENAWVWDRFEKQLRHWTTQGKRVVVILSTPRGPVFNPRRMVNRDGLSFEVHPPAPFPAASVLTATQIIDTRIKGITERASASWISPTEWVCPHGICLPFDNGPIYKDDSHMRASVARERFSAVDQFIKLSS
jgi:peptidoglycan/LPS O-acetylase OafA/YrhL